MREKLISYIDFLFKDAPESADLKSEILSNSLDKYDDLVASGTAEEDAFNIAVSGIGDVGSLIDSQKKTKEETSESAKTRAALLSVSVALYILSIIPPIIFDSINEALGCTIMFVMIAVATAIIIYRSTAYKKYEPKSNTQSEKIKARNIEESDKMTLKRSIQGAIWALTVVVYFLVSFSTMAWYVTWVIFLIGTAISNIIGAIFTLRK